MNSKRSYSQNQLRDYSSLFSRSSVQEWMKGDLSSIDYKINRYDGHWFSEKNKRYIDYLKFVYYILENHYQNEYILKNAFLNKWLIKELGECSSQVFSEFRVGTAIADLAMFNGTSKVFEIKTELDSDKRLNSQLEQYRKAFNQIFLIVPFAKLHQYQNYGSSVGIITFNKTKTLEFNIERAADLNSTIDPKTLMQIFHTNEYKGIVKAYYGELPIMTSFNQFQVCSEIINNIPNSELNCMFIDQMKKRNKSNSLSNRCNKEFNQLSLALGMSNKNWKHLFSILRSPLNG